MFLLACFPAPPRKRELKNALLCYFAPPLKDILTEHLEGTVWQRGKC